MRIILSTNFIILKIQFISQCAELLIWWCGCKRAWSENIYILDIGRWYVYRCWERIAFFYLKVHYIWVARKYIYTNWHFYGFYFLWVRNKSWCHFQSYVMHILIIRCVSLVASYIELTCLVVKYIIVNILLYSTKI